MKRYISAILAVLLLVTCLFTGIPSVQAAKKEETRTIAIVFDNSGSMYDAGDKAWCRATYAMEVFASMLNKGDILQIYPMHPIKVGGTEYTMQNPLQITDAAQASTIREIYTEYPGGTPIESVDCAIDGLRAMKGDNKYLIILTDGGEFSVNGGPLTKSQTKKELEKRIEASAGPEMTVMYLGIDVAACIPDTKQSEYFVKRHAVDTQDVLSYLTEMCNLVFGRDCLPKNHISGKTVDFDISMKKLIVFVQGENIADLKISGASADQLISAQQTKYSTLGTEYYTSNPDTSLQGMMVTYKDFAAGTYTIEYTGTATSVEVYYEPDADLDFVFTDSAGNAVDPNALYEGDYKVSFGIKDARTGKLISSDLLGSPHYQGSYFINGQDFVINHDGQSGEEAVTLKNGDVFTANLTVTYLSGYTITKDETDFGWREGGIIVVPRPAGELRLEISGGDDIYTLQTLEEGSPYIAKVYYNGQQLTGDELEKVDLKWQPETSNAEITEEFAGDHYKLWLEHKDPAAPKDTVCGECTVTIHAFYAAQGSSEAEAQCPMSYEITDEVFPIEVQLRAPESYIVISDLETSQAIVATVKVNGNPMTAEDFNCVQLQVDCGGLEYTLTPREQDSSYLIKLLPTDGIGEGNYRIQVTAQYTDAIGTVTQAEDALTITLSNTPLWVRWAISIALLVILAVIIWSIMHIRVLPKYMHTTRRLSSMNFDGEDVTQATNFLAEIKKKGAKVQSQYAGRKFGISMDVTPGKESYLYKSQKRRSAQVKVTSVRKFGPAKIQEAMIGSAKYVMDEDTGKLVPALPNQKPFTLTNGMMVKYSGVIQDAGVDKDFEATSKLNFKKK